MKRLFFFASLLILMALACTPPIYFPNQVNTPLMKEKGDLHANLSAGLNGFNLQAAYGTTDHLGVMAAGSVVDLSNGDRVWQAEAGAGYFRALSDLFRMEAYGVLGIGQSQYTSRGGNLFRAALQPGIAFAHKIVDFGFTPRLSYIRFYGYSDPGVPNLSPVQQDMFFEPTATLRLGYKYVKAQGQIGFSFPFSSNFAPRRFKGIFTLGVVMNLNVLSDLSE